MVVGLVRLGGAGSLGEGVGGFLGVAGGSLGLWRFSEGG